MKSADFANGLLELCVLICLQEQEQYGYAILTKVKKVFPEVYRGSIYTVLNRLEKNGYITTLFHSSSTADGPPRKYFRITQKGREEATSMKQEWLNLNERMNLFLKEEETPMKRMLCMLMATATMLTGCTSSSKGTIQVATAYDYKYFTQVVEQYNKKADIPIELMNLNLVVENSVQNGAGAAENSEEDSNPWAWPEQEQYLKAVNTSLLSGEGYDIISIGEYHDYVRKGLLVNLDELIAKEENTPLAGLDTNAIDKYRSEDGLFVLPISTNAKCVITDSSLLSMLNIKIDDTKWDYGILLNIAEQIAVARESGLTEKYAFSCSGRMSNGAELFTYANAYSQFVDHENNTASFDSAEFIAVLELFKKLGSERYVSPEKNTISGGGSIAGYRKAQESAAFLVVSLLDYDLRTYKDRMGGSVALLKPPALPGKEAISCAEDSLFAINKNSPYVDEAWELLKLMIAPQNQEVIGIPDKENHNVSLDAFPVDLQARKKLGAFQMQDKNEKDKKYQSYKSTITTEDITMIDNYLDQINTVHEYNESAMTQAICIEAEKFFTGGKTAQEVSKIIQAKVALIMGERS